MDEGKTKAQPIAELAELRRRIAELEASETKRKQVEEALDIERRQLLSIFDSIDEVVYVSDPDTYEILYVNQTLVELFGDVIGQKCYRALQNLESPCSFCTNEHIFGEHTGQPYIWECQYSDTSVG